MRLAISQTVLLASFASALDVYLNPPLSTATAFSTIPTFSPPEARVVLAHHLGLEAHESVTSAELEFLDNTFNGFGDELGRETPNALLVSLSQSIAKRECGDKYTYMGCFC